MHWSWVSCPTQAHPKRKLQVISTLQAAGHMCIYIWLELVYIFGHLFHPQAGLSSKDWLYFFSLICSIDESVSSYCLISLWKAWAFLWWHPIGIRQDWQTSPSKAMKVFHTYWSETSGPSISLTICFCLPTFFARVVDLDWVFPFIEITNNINFRSPNVWHP